jgi:transcriptional regulator with XRE-family HTH domain
MSKTPATHESQTLEASLIGGVALVDALLLPSPEAFRAAKHRAAIPVELFRVQGRKGWFARREDVLAWQRAQLPEAGGPAAPIRRVVDSSLSYGQLLKSLRLKKCMSQKELALALGIDQSYLAALESGRRKPPKEPLFSQVLAAIGASDEERAMVLLAAEFYELRRGATKLKSESSPSVLRLVEMLALLRPDDVRTLYEHADGLLLRARRSQMT